MKRSELRNIIKEEIEGMLNEQQSLTPDQEILLKDLYTFLKPYSTKMEYGDIINTLDHLKDVYK